MASEVLGKVKQTIALVTVGVLLGASLTWVMTGLEPGSKADWAAAGGTWVIGIAACALTFLQVRSALVAKHTSEVRQLRVMSVQARSLCVVARRLTEFEGEQLKSSSPRIVIGAMERRCSSIHLDLAVVDTDDEFEAAVSQFDYHVMAVHSLCKSILEIAEPASSIKLGAVPEYKWALEQAEKLIKSAEALESQIQRTISLIRRRSSGIGL
ncbi:MAG: hypothetical protein ACN6RF_12795 [Stenotrophomonas sp.]